MEFKTLIKVWKQLKPLHGSWYQATRAALLEAFRYQGAMTRALTEKLDGLVLENRQLKREQAAAWGIRICCDGTDCWCQGRPIDPPPWWEAQDAEIQRLKAKITELELALDGTNIEDRRGVR